LLSHKVNLRSPLTAHSKAAASAHGSPFTAHSKAAHRSLLGPGGAVFTRLRHEDAVPGRAQRGRLPDRVQRGRGGGGSRL